MEPGGRPTLGEDKPPPLTFTVGEKTNPLALCVHMVQSVTMGGELRNCPSLLASPTNLRSAASSCRTTSKKLCKAASAWRWPSCRLGPRCFRLGSLRQPLLDRWTIGIVVGWIQGGVRISLVGSEQGSLDLYFVSTVVLCSHHGEEAYKAAAS